MADTTNTTGSTPTPSLAISSLVDGSSECNTEHQSPMPISHSSLSDSQPRPPLNFDDVPDEIVLGDRLHFERFMLTNCHTSEEQEALKVHRRRRKSALYARRHRRKRSARQRAKETAPVTQYLPETDGVDGTTSGVTLTANEDDPVAKRVARRHQQTDRTATQGELDQLRAENTLLRQYVQQLQADPRLQVPLPQHYARLQPGHSGTSEMTSVMLPPPLQQPPLVTQRISQAGDPPSGAFDNNHQLQLPSTFATSTHLPQFSAGNAFAMAYPQPSGLLPSGPMGMQQSYNIPFYPRAPNSLAQYGFQPPTQLNFALSPMHAGGLPVAGMQGLQPYTGVGHGNGNGSNFAARLAPASHASQLYTTGSSATR
eukprot:m.175864 g.175864  ORF g.175864 m.175864 type:complete len:370 (-) comp16791_c0_seq10:46-1155(-)